MLSIRECLGLRCVTRGEHLWMISRPVGGPGPRTAFGGWDHKASTFPGLKAALRGGPTSTGPPSHTCGNTRGGAGGGATSNWSPRTQGGTTNQSVPNAVEVPPSEPSSVLPRPASPGILSSPARALAVTNSPSASKGKRVPKRGRFSESQENKAVEGLPAIP